MNNISLIFDEEDQDNVLDRLYFLQYVINNSLQRFCNEQTL